jgi:phage tail-like protein
MSNENTTWPLPKFYFSVTGLASPASFQEVTGLESEAQVIEYRAGDSKGFNTIKMPGLAKNGNVTLKKGIFVTDSNLWTWFSTIAMNTIPRSTVVVNLLDETGAPRVTWTLNNAFPTKYSGTDLKSDGNEVAVETMEVAYETLTMKYA